MREIIGDLWTIKADARVIPTNGFIKKNGEGVMGRGVALQMKQRYPHAPAWLGNHLIRNGNHVGRCSLPKRDLLFIWFPVKITSWRDDASLTLIERSCQELVALVSPMWNQVALPRVGCGNGGLDWEDVKPILEEYLDDRFIVVKWKEEEK